MSVSSRNSSASSRVADPGSGAFLTPGSGMGKKSGTGIGDNHPGSATLASSTSKGQSTFLYNELFFVTLNYGVFKEEKGHVNEFRS
jgi:hypothetical protein